jgi:hypothetical protein
LGAILGARFVLLDRAPLGVVLGVSVLALFAAHRDGHLGVLIGGELVQTR